MIERTGWMSRQDERLQLHYFHEIDLPNQLAATIQILRTGAAFVDGGDAFTLHAREIRLPRKSVLGSVGVAPQRGLAVAPFYGDLSLWRPVRAGLRATRYARLARRGAAHEPASILMTRGESAFALLPALERRRRSRKTRAWPHLAVYELHRLAHIRIAEKRLGRRARSEELDTPEFRAICALERRAIAASDALVCLTPAVAEAVRKTHGLERPTLILPSGVSLPTAGNGPARSEGRKPEFDVVYAGKIEARKGVRTLCEAVRRLPGRRLAIAGGPDEAAEALRTRLRRDGLAERIHVLGWIPSAEVPDLLRRGRVGACPLPSGADAVSDRFTSPMKLLEMMALGLPVVATDIEPIRAIAEDGVHALLVAPNDPDAFALGIERLLTDHDLAARLGAAARDRAAEFTWSRRAERLARFLRARLAAASPA